MRNWGINMLVLNYVITVLFVAVIVYLLMGLFKSFGKVQIKDRDWSPARIVFLIAFGLAFLMFYTAQGVYDYARTIITIIALGLFYFLRDGIGEEGIVTLAHFTPWSEIRGYDYRREKKAFAVYFVEEKKSKSNTDYSIVMNFDLKNEEAVKKLLEKACPKKHIRFKK